MAVNFSEVVYKPGYDVFARPITVTPIASQPNAAAYGARGIYDTRELDVVAMDGSIISDQKTICDILDAEFTVLPVQHDLIAVPASAGLPDEGVFEVLDADRNGGGETMLTLRKVVTAKP